MEILQPEIRDYVHALTPSTDPILLEMEEEARQRRFPIIGPQCGRLLHLLALIAGARRIFEMGSGFGYSTYWFAQALPDDGEIHHTEMDPQNSEKAREYLERGQLAQKVRFHIEDARDALRKTSGEFDIILIDSNKDQYPECFALAIERLRSGGVMIVDNAFLNGNVLDSTNTNPGPEGIRELTRRMFNDSQMISTLIPLRDGLLIGYKK